MDVTTLSLLASFLIVVVSGSTDSEYSNVGNISMSAAWNTLTRPMPAPQSALKISVAFYIYKRGQPVRCVVTTPDLALTGSDLSGGRDTYFLTHGFMQDGNATWLSDAKDLLLLKFDVNVVIVDWGRGSKGLNYLQAAANIRVVAAETIRLCNYLMSAKGSSPSSWHMIGHSLGAHIFSYVGKAIPGVGVIIALEPAQPWFEGYDKAVRLDVSDALFVVVIHTNAVPFIPLGGYGMMGTYGHCDFYVNGGMYQPGCPDLPSDMNVTNLSNPEYDVEAANYILNCHHFRSIRYFLESLVNSCTFWGRKASVFPTKCTASSCSPMGLNATQFPARGSFLVVTNFASSFCIADPATDAIMEKYRQG